MIANSKFRRIARDLEKLPCELHESVLADLEFHQLIRLSSCAGAGLTWSIENSLLPWKSIFRHEHIGKLQKLLTITDKVKMFCFAVPKTKDDQSYIFQRAELSFLLFKSSQWKANHFQTLARYWLKKLNEIVLETTWPAFHEIYSHLVEPWVAEVPGARNIFEKIPYLGQEDRSSYNETYVHLGKRINTKELFAMDELATFIELYQQVRLKRAETLSGELFRLADMYEAHATRLKMPFDPRQYPPEAVNATHVPTMMRYQARRIINIAKCAPWNRTDVFKHRFAWPALVPYDWCAQLFNERVIKPGILENGTPSDGNGRAQLTTAAMTQECRDVVAKRPSWAMGVPEDMSLEIKVRVQVHQADVKRTQLGKVHIRPRGDVELQWLEEFAQVTGSLEQEFS